MRLNAVLAASGLFVFFLAGLSSASGMEIVRDREARAVIVTPDDPFPVAQRAAEELQYHIRKATGAELAIIPEGRSAAQELNRIYLGDCEATWNAGIDVESLTPAGFVIRLIGNNLFIAGHDSGGTIGSRWASTRHGTLFGVYEFLEKEMDVRWLWPGELGEVIPPRSDLVLTGCEHERDPPFFDTGWGLARLGDAYWPTPESFERFQSDQIVWSLRHRFNTSTVQLYTSHYFHSAGYNRRFLDSRPDFFQQIPDGTRGFLPGTKVVSEQVPYGGHRISMCVSNPDLHKQMVADWKAARPADPTGRGYLVVNACENDTAGSCTCDNCRAWDAPDPRFDNHDYWSDGKVVPNDNWQAGRTDSQGRPAPSLSDRYARFYLAVQKEAEKVDPDVIVSGYAYANYKEPPVQTKLNDRIVIVLVGWPYFPWTEADIAEMREFWDGWRATGAKLFLRPNTMLSGHNLPYNFARKLGGQLSYAYSNGMAGNTFDSMTGQWAAQGPNLYVLGRFLSRPDLPVEKILDEYYGGFGQASGEVRAYFEYWEKAADRFSDEDYLKDAFTGEVTEQDSGRRLGYRRPLWRLARAMYTPEVMAEGRRLLNQAQRAARGDSIAEKRVDFLEKGLAHAELTMDAARAHADHQQNSENPILTPYADNYTGKLGERYKSAIDKLVEFRKLAVEEHPNFSNIGWMTFQEWAVLWAHFRPWDPKTPERYHLPPSAAD